MAERCSQCGGAPFMRGLCEPCYAQWLEVQKRSSAEFDRRVALEALERAKRFAFVPHAWADDRASYERAVANARLRALSNRYSLEAGSLLVLGPTGVGKTVSVARALRRLVAEATRADAPVLRLHWTCASALALARRQHPLGAGEAPELAHAKVVPVLVVDELGAELFDPALFEVLDARYQCGAVTLTTSGMRRAELAERYGDAFCRRLTAPHGAVVEAW